MRRLAVLALLALLAVVVPADRVFAQVPSVVISEIFYNPDGQDEGHEFVELLNAGDTFADLSGWSFSSGIEATFAPGTILGAGQRFVVAADATAFEATFGVRPNATFTGALSNGGETLTLVDAAGSTIDDVDYDDELPWALSADGGGSSLNLFDAASADRSAANWRAGPPTPGDPSGDLELPELAPPRALTENGYAVAGATAQFEAPMPGVELRYTTDGSEPTSESPIVGAGGVTIEAGLAFVRVRSFAPGYAPSETVTVMLVDAAGIAADMGAGAEIATAIESLPVMSISTVDGSDPRSKDVSAPGRVDYLDPGDGPGFSAGTGITQFGQWTYAFGYKKNYRLKFSSDFGLSDLEYPLFDPVPGAAVQPRTTFDWLELRGFGLDGFVGNGSMMSNAFARQLMLELGSLSTHGRYVNLFVNGVYRGPYMLRERVGHDWMASYLGGTADDYESWRIDDYRGIETLLHGDGSVWARFESATRPSDVPGDVDMRAIVNTALAMWHARGYLELEWRIVAPSRADAPGGLVIMPNDLDRQFAPYYSLGRSTGFRQFLSNFAQDPAFLAEMHAHTAWAFCDGGPMSPERTVARFDEYLALLDPVADAEDWVNGGWRASQWRFWASGFRGRLADDMVAVRSAWQAAGWFTGCDGAEPPPVEVLDVPEGALAIEEVHYNPLDGAVDAVPADGDRFEFIELRNTTDAALAVGGVAFVDGIDFAFAPGANLGPGQRLVLASDASAFAERYGFVPDGVFAGQLANEGESIAIATAAGTPVAALDYDDRAPWPIEPDGNGPSLVAIGSADAPPEGWAASAEIHGSPGAANVMVGDPDCDGSPGIVDALLVAQFAVGNRTAAACPLSDPATQIAVAAADVNRDDRVDIVDALLMTQCVVGIPNEACPA